MANPHRGGVVLEAGGKTYTLSYSVNAICELEEELGMSVGKITQALEDPSGVSMGTIRALVWAGLQDNHEVSIKDAGYITSDAGIPVVVEKVGEAFRLAFPEEGAKDAARPPKAKGRSTR